jgi:hypothetical protein
MVVKRSTLSRSRPRDAQSQPRRLGPRGGRTTVTPGGLNRLSTYLLPDEREAVRRRAFEEDNSISEVIRSAIRSYLDLP